MKKKEKTSLIQKTESELAKLARDLGSEIEKLGLTRNSEQQKNTRGVRELKKKVAVVKTILHMRQLGGTK